MQALFYLVFGVATAAGCYFLNMEWTLAMVVTDEFFDSECNNCKTLNLPINASLLM